MIKIVAKMPVKQSEVETFKSIAKELVEKSSAEEGNITYSINVSAADPCLFAFIEFWKDQAAMDIHNKTEHFTSLFPKLAALTSGDMSVEVFHEV